MPDATRQARRRVAGWEADGGDIVRFVLAPCLVIIYLIAFARVLLSAHPPSPDFLGFWSAGRLALTHAPASAYDPEALIRAQGLDGKFFAFLYPPPFLAVVLPFALTPYRLALAAWMALSLGALGFAARTLAPKMVWVAMAFPAVLVGVCLGQSGPLIGALFVGAAALTDRRPFVAGLLLGALVCKPQLALMVPIALVAAADRRVLAGAAVSAAGLLVGALVAFGWSAYAGFLAEAPLASRVLDDPDLWPKMVGLYPSLRLLGLSAGAAAAAQLALSGACAAVVWRSWRAPGELAAKMAVLAAAGVLATPYAFTYDLALLIVPMGWLAAAEGRGSRISEKAALAGVFLLPLITPGLATATRLNPAWLLLAALLWEIARRAVRPLRRATPYACSSTSQ